MFIVKSSVCVAVERQDSMDSAEYHSQLEDNREEEEEEEEEEGEEMAWPLQTRKVPRRSATLAYFERTKAKTNGRINLPQQQT